MKSIIVCLTIGCALMVSAAASAEEAASAIAPFTLTGGIDYTNAYYCRGYLYEDSRPIVQPYATLAAPVYSSDDFSITPNIGTWHSIHAADTGAEKDPRSWFEADYRVGSDFTYHNWTLNVSYYWYTYPSGALKGIDELDFCLSYNDAELMKKAGLPFTLNPYVTWAFETLDGNGALNQYVELGMVPSYEIPNTPVRLSLPLAVGLSPNGYYTRDDGSVETLGFASAGVLMSVKLPVPAKMGDWKLNTSVTYIRLYADSVKTSNEGDKDDVIAKIGLGFAF